ncbi:MAG: SCO family protein [Woeseiaceae bacterium]|nr:SCO family protein [Woeseiaceae bacterium]
MGSRKLLVAAVAVVAIAAGTWLSFNTSAPPAEPRVATLLPAKVELPEFALLDHTGSPVDRSVFDGQWDLVFFGFTHCPDICPLTLQVLASARSQMADEGFEVLPRIVLVSVDPERDAPEKLARYVGYFGDGTFGITGELDELRKLTGALGIWFEKSALDGDDYAVDHSAAVLLIDPEGSYRAVFSTPHEAENFAHDVPIIMGLR